ncbi:hypothetical protein IV498_01945 [Paenarthrobacter sp. Z7-10]|uniref:hypothetical protein n=1 Tax=Paenarthrobacter sp. Z7-10 TaxID=2787635 RepID=UPI0022A90C0C|nr:hypothetical protein [Paenarthrobacter sp. Z7-10]MCZ2401978.1 hypothetical protein [Paenarthrobacter sp. Z7-10]
MARQGVPGDGRDRERPAQGRPASPRATARRRSPSARVLRRRRAVVSVVALLVLLALVAGVAYFVGKLGDAVPAASTASQSTAGPASTAAAAASTEPSASSPAATSSADDTPSPTPTLGEAPPCGQDQLVVGASVDSPVYPTGKNPVLTLTVTNSSDSPCSVNLGTSQMEFLIKSGGDRIFSSKDCQQGAEDLQKNIAPGTSETAKFPWSRNRTVPGCKSVTAIPKPGNYVYQAKLGQHLSDSVPFTLQ